MKMLFLWAMPCQGGFYVSGNLGIAFTEFIPENKMGKAKPDIAQDRCAKGGSVSFLAGYGLVMGGKYIGGRLQIPGKDWGEVRTEFSMPVFFGVQPVLGLYLTPSNLFYVAPGIEISLNKHARHHKDENHKTDWGWVISVGSRTMITGHLFWHIEGTYVHHNKATDEIKDLNIDWFNKHSLRVCIGGGYNF